ncbi:hypothetical protein Igag_0583 [Ignisphaera aggregans DSM 17230]|uniref:Uncharacterized protein n=1 Tax=Ignisphaera aggregans (strain DSM 17230 / JCM 13409 / AQ1.S1) TaxID=583356 RepID=E0SSE5_IGNAA|nr:hypothetical protein Igag_0583 [Ignisphaera aggregans DSM 17230]
MYLMSLNIFAYIDMYTMVHRYGNVYLVKIIKTSNLIVVVVDRDLMDRELCRTYALV